jgi:hypothetical protein
VDAVSVFLKIELWVYSGITIQLETTFLEMNADKSKVLEQLQAEQDKVELVNSQLVAKLAENAMLNMCLASITVELTPLKASNQAAGLGQEDLAKEVEQLKAKLADKDVKKQKFEKELREKLMAGFRNTMAEGNKKQSELIERYKQKKVALAEAQTKEQEYRAKAAKLVQEVAKRGEAEMARNQKREEEETKRRKAEAQTVERLKAKQAEMVSLLNTAIAYRELAQKQAAEATDSQQKAVAKATEIQQKAVADAKQSVAEAKESGQDLKAKMFDLNEEVARLKAVTIQKDEKIKEAEALAEIAVKMAEDAAQGN